MTTAAGGTYRFLAAQDWPGPEWGARPVTPGRAGPVRSAAARPTAPSPPPAAPNGAPDDRLFRRLHGTGAAAARAALLAELPRHTQRIVVVSVTGGAGRSVLTAGLGLAIAAHRRWPVAVVDGSHEPFGALAVRSGAPTGPTLADAAPVLERVSAGTQLERQVRVVRVNPAVPSPARDAENEGAGPGSGVHVFAAPDPGQHRLSPQGLAWLLARLGELYPTVLVDSPAGLLGPYPQAALAGATAVIVATRARAEEIRRTAAALAALHRVTPHPASRQVVGVVVADRRRGWDRRAAAAEPVLGGQCATVVRLPWSPALAAGAPATRAGPRTDRTLQEIAAGVLATHAPARGTGR